MTHVENTGQIQLGQTFGQWIAKYAADTRFHRYLEIGTWNGRGSTCCFYKGLKDRTDGAYLQSYEIHGPRAQEAKEVWKTAPQIHVIHGRALQNWECPTWDAVTAVIERPTLAWHFEDIQYFWSCSYVAPEDPHVVLLDGGECLTWFEFQKIWKECPSTSVYMLDDTLFNKCAKIKAFLEDHPDWIKVAGSDTERNGWAVFEKVTASAEQTPETPAVLEQ